MCKNSLDQELIKEFADVAEWQWFPVPGRLNSHMANLLISFYSSCKKGGGVRIQLQHVLSHKTASFLSTNMQMYNLAHKCMNVCPFSKNCQKICSHMCLCLSPLFKLCRVEWAEEVTELNCLFVWCLFFPASPQHPSTGSTFTLLCPHRQQSSVWANTPTHCPINYLSLCYCCSPQS